jgi:hypothetical protein
LHAFAIDPVSFAAQPGRQAAAAQEGMICVFAVDHGHQCQILRRLGAGLVVVARAADAEQFALPAHAEAAVTGIDPGAFVFKRSWQLFF